MKRFISPLFISAALTLSSTAFADTKHDEKSAGPKPSAATATSSDMAEAEVRKIDKEQGKITLKHGELKSLDMPAMTMVFRVKDPAMLDKLAQGDKIKFQAEKLNGVLTVTRAEKMK